MDIAERRNGCCHPIETHPRSISEIPKEEITGKPKLNATRRQIRQKNGMAGKIVLKFRLQPSKVPCGHQKIRPNAHLPPSRPEHGQNRHQKRSSETTQPIGKSCNLQQTRAFDGTCYLSSFAKTCVVPSPRRCCRCLAPTIPVTERRLNLLPIKVSSMLISE